MIRFRAFVIGSSAALAAFGCAQLAGLTDDYRLGAAGGAGASDSSGGSLNGGSLGDAGDGPVLGDAGASSGETHGGASGKGGVAGDGSGGRSHAGAANGGATSSGGAANGGAANAGGATAGFSNGGQPGGGNAGTSGAAGNAGAGGSTPRIVRVGYSEFHDSASGSDQASSHLADATFTKPAATAAGDFMLVFFGSDHRLGNLSGTDLDAKGWTLIDQHEDYGTDGQGMYLMYKFAGPNEPNSIVFSEINSTPSGNGVQGLLSVYRGVDPAEPVNDYQITLEKTGHEGVTHATTPTPAVTTTVADTLLIAGLSPDSAIDAPVVSMWPAGFTENQVSVMNPAHPYPYGWANIYTAERHLALPSTVVSSSFEWDLIGADKYLGSLSFVLALAPK